MLVEGDILEYKAEHSIDLYPKYIMVICTESVLASSPYYMDIMDLHSGKITQRWRATIYSKYKKIEE